MRTLASGWNNDKICYLLQGYGESGSRWLTFNEVLTLRHHDAVGSDRKEHLAAEGLPTKIVAVANFKGGSGMTTTCAHLAMSATLDGYKVLVLKLDSQTSTTSIPGG